MMKELVQQAKTMLGITLTPVQIAAFEEYEHLLIEWNSKFNLTAIRTPEEIRTKHFLDSLTAVQMMRDTPVERVIDIGSGAGFPGIPLKIVCTSMKLTLVESVGKKAAFCSRAAEALKLDGVRVVQSRAEELGHEPEFREHYDWAVARAVALIPVLAEILVPLVKVGGQDAGHEGRRRAF